VDNLLTNLVDNNGRKTEGKFPFSKYIPSGSEMLQGEHGRMNFDLKVRLSW